jgi:phosphoglycolate phosphatase
LTQAVRLPKGILFDKDGTLLDYALSWSHINLDAGHLAAQGEPELAARLLKVGGADPDTGLAVADSLLAAGNSAEIAAAWVAAGSPLHEAQLTATLDRLFREAVSRMVPVTDLRALFVALKARGLILGIASSDSAGAIHDTLAHFNLSDVTDFVAGYDSGHGFKPGPGLLAAFCAACDLLPDEVVMVGDNLHDMEMGRRGGAGWRVGVLTGTGTRASLAPHSDLVLENIAELEAALFSAAL